MERASRLRVHEESSTSPLIFRAGVHLYAVIGVFVLLFAALGAFIVVKRGDWTYLAVVVGAAAVLFLLLQLLRLEVGSDGFKYRNLSGSREIAFTEVRRAYIDVVRSEYAPQGAARFWIERRDGGRVKVNLRTFPVRAAAILFTALEAHATQIEVPEEWAARRMVQQVRAAQAKLSEKNKDDAARS
jgi:hypothetical protein